MNSIKSTKKNIRRTPYQAMAATMVMFFTFLILSSFMFLALGSQQLLKFYESKPQAIAFFKDGTTDSDINLIQGTLAKVDNSVKFKYVSKEDALEIYKEQNKSDPLLLELVTASILPASLEISTNSVDTLKVVADVIRKEPVVEQVIFPEDVISYLSKTTNLIRIVGGSITVFMMVFSTLIIIMIIGFKIRLKRDEIETMKLLGASTWFIRMPYVIEGITYALIGAVLGWAVSYSAIWYFEPFLHYSLKEAASQLLPIPTLVLAEILAAEILVALIVGGLGSLVAVRRYLHI